MTCVSDDMVATWAVERAVAVLKGRLPPYIQGPVLLLIFIFIFFSHTSTFQLLFWTSRGHRCRPFSPPVLAFNFYRA